MRMPVMHVGLVRMRVHHRRMDVDMRVWLATVPGKIVCVPMVFVMRVGVRVLLGFVRVQMPVSLGHMQPYADRHQRACGDQLDAKSILAQDHRKRGAKERSDREIRSGSGASKVAKRDHEQDQADTVAEESNGHRGAENARGGSV